MDDVRFAKQHAALAHPLRIAIVRLLAAADDGGVSAGMIATTLGSSPSNLTHHTSALTASGLVTARRSGNEIRFSIDRDEVAGLGLHLDDLAAQRGVGSDETGLSPADLVKPTR